MNVEISDSVQGKLCALDQEIRRRAMLAAAGYSLGLLGAVSLYVYFPFSLSRIGSVVLMIALAHMLWKVYAASRQTAPLGRLDAQIRLIQSAIYHLPFLVGANLFFMGLPGTGSAVSKAWLDCFFLLGTVIVFTGLYFANQKTVGKELLPLRRELEQLFNTSARGDRSHRPRR